METSPSWIVAFDLPTEPGSNLLKDNDTFPPPPILATTNTIDLLILHSLRESD